MELVTVPHSRGIPEPAEYVKFARRILRGLGRRMADADPEDLAQLIALHREVGDVVQDTIDTGRERWGWTWEDIGQAAGTSRSAAFQRWGKAKAQPEQSSPQNATWRGAEPWCCYADCTRGDVSEWKLPDGTTGVYCPEHGPVVVERIRQRLIRQGVAP